MISPEMRSIIILKSNELENSPEFVSADIERQAEMCAGLEKELREIKEKLEVVGNDRQAVSA